MREILERRDRDARGVVVHIHGEADVRCRMVAMVVGAAAVRLIRASIVVALALRRRVVVLRDGRCMVRSRFECARKGIGDRHDHQHCQEQCGDDVSQSGGKATHRAGKYSPTSPDTITKRRRKERGSVQASFRFMFRADAAGAIHWRTSADGDAQPANTSRPMS